MISYDSGDYHLGFIWRLEGSIVPKAAFFSIAPAFLAIMCRYILVLYEVNLEEMTPALKSTAVWSCITVVLGMLLGFRTNKAYARFWEGTTLVQMMRAEWFESCSNLMSFSSISITKNPADTKARDSVNNFRYTLVRLMSLMHGAALRQIGGNSEEFDVLDVHGLDEESMEYLNQFCSQHDINRVEVLLHWIQVLITDNIATGVLSIPPPILTRSYQTLSRGMVNFYNVRKLADIPFPFPLSQIILVLLLLQSVMTPIFVATIIPSYTGCAIVSFVPLFGMWSVTFISGELEQPFGLDANDLPLSVLQFQMNTSLLMLLDDCSQRPPKLRSGCHATVHELRTGLGDPASSTEVMRTSTLVFSSRASSRTSRKVTKHEDEANDSLGKDTKTFKTVVVVPEHSRAAEPEKPQGGEAPRNAAAEPKEPIDAPKELTVTSKEEFVSTKLPEKQLFETPVNRAVERESTALTDASKPSIRCTSASGTELVQEFTDATQYSKVSDSSIAESPWECSNGVVNFGAPSADVGAPPHGSLAEFGFVEDFSPASTLTQRHIISPSMIGRFVTQSLARPQTPHLAAPQFDTLPPVDGRQFQELSPMMLDLRVAMPLRPPRVTMESDPPGEP